MPAHLPQLARRTFLGGGVALATLPFPSFAQAAAPTRDPNAGAVLALFDPVGGPEGRAAFHAAILSPAGQRRWPLPEFERVYGAIADQSGGFDLIAADRRGNNLWLTLRARRLGIERPLRVRIDRDDPARIFDVSASPMPMPWFGVMPTAPITPATIAAWAERRLLHSALRDEFSGACRIVAPSGEVVYEAAFGRARRGPDIANTHATRFNIGSADKSFTALMIANLVAEGRLGFDTPLAEVLPDYPDASFARTCTLRHLLSHSAGLAMLFHRPGWDWNRDYAAMADIMAVSAGEPAAFAPGAGAAYSNEGFIVLGAVLERVTGRRWHDLLAEQVYVPAGMADSGHFRKGAMPERVATGYRYHPDDHLGLAAREPNDAMVGVRGNACGGGYATVGDMTRYLAALRGGRIAPLPVVEQMIVQQRPGLGNYGLGLEVQPIAPGRTLIGHEGSGAHSGIDGATGIVWETGWAFSILGNYDSPFTKTIAVDFAQVLAMAA